HRTAVGDQGQGRRRRRLLVRTGELGPADANGTPELARSARNCYRFSKIDQAGSLVPHANAPSRRASKLADDAGGERDISAAAVWLCVVGELPRRIPARR